MSDLRDFVLNFLQVNGAIVEAPRYGLHEVLLPDTLAEEMDVPALQEIVFDEAEPAEADGRLHLAPGHPLVDRMVERARLAASPMQSYINAVRLDKRGLAQLARQTLSFANARLVEVPQESEAPALFHYLVLTFKVTLTTDEKQEQLVTVALHAQSGWPVEWEAIRARVALDEEPAFGHLALARPCWVDEPHPLTSESLTGLLDRARRAVLANMADSLEGVSRRAARHLELDRARLEQYYDDLARDLERRLRRAEGERQAALRDKTTAVQAEREIKLADAEARYRLRTDLELITGQVIIQPKLELLVQIENRNTTVQRRVVWDPLLHCIEPLACDVCGQPGVSLQLCTGGHLAHAECLVQHQCIDCKRVYCRLCQDKITACAVCGRPVCQASLNRCSICKRGTCREHTGLCHAADGAPAAVAKPAVGTAPLRKPVEPAPVAKAGVPLTAPKSRPEKRPTKAPASSPPLAPARPGTADWKLAVEIDGDEPVVKAFVLATRKRGPAVRIWRLTPQGIRVTCDCEKVACPEDHKVMRPPAVEAVEAMLRGEIERLRREYGVPVRGVSYTAFVDGMARSRPRLILRGQWKDEKALAEARAGFDAVYARQHPVRVPQARERATPAVGAPRSLQPQEVAEAERFLNVALGLLKLEGTLSEDELYWRVCSLLRPGGWCTPGQVGALLRLNKGLFKVLASGLVSSHDVSNVQALAARKRACRLPPVAWEPEVLLSIAQGKQPLSELEGRTERELRELCRSEVSVRVIQRELRRGVLPADVVAYLKRYLLASDPQAHSRIAELITELSAHTPRWELGGRTPAEVE